MFSTCLSTLLSEVEIILGANGNILTPLHMFSEAVAVTDPC